MRHIRWRGLKYRILLKTCINIYMKIERFVLVQSFHYEINKWKNEINGRESEDKRSIDEYLVGDRSGELSLTITETR